MVKKTRGMRMNIAKARARSTPGGKGRVRKRHKGRIIMRT